MSDDTAQLYVAVGLVSCCLPLHKVVSENVVLYYLHFVSRFVTVSLSVLHLIFSLCTADNTAVIKNCVPCTGPLEDTHTHTHKHTHTQTQAHTHKHTHIHKHTHTNTHTHTHTNTRTHTHTRARYVSH